MKGTADVDGGAVLRLLAAGTPLPQVPERVSREGETVALTDVEVLLGKTRDLVGRVRLEPAAASAFRESFRGRFTAALLAASHAAGVQRDVKTAFVEAADARPPEDMAQLADSARKLLDEYATACQDAASAANQPPVDVEGSIALSYAEAVVRQVHAREALSAIAADPSSLHFGLPPDDLKRLDEILLDQAVRGPFFTLDALVRRWEQFVEGVEAEPGKWLREELEDRLDSRSLLERALLALSPAASEKLRARISEADRRFESATRSVAERSEPRDAP